MASLEIRLFGGFEMRFDKAPLDPFPLRAARSLLAFLVMNRDRPHSRELLAGTFWPHLSDAHARRRLSQALWQVRASLRGLDELAETLVLATGSSIRCNPDADLCLDVERFEQSIEQANRAAAVQHTERVRLLKIAAHLYRGDLLDGFYDDWALLDRERLRGSFLTSLEVLTDLLMGSSDYEEALVYARALAQHEPLREESHQRVMRLMVLLGRHTEALRQYERCRQILADELGARPSQTTDGLRRAAARERSVGDRGPRAPHATAFSRKDDRVVFVGREREKSALCQRLDAALGGSGGLVLVEGDAGVGKTCLIREVAEDARWRGMDVFWGSASSHGRRPYAPLAEALTNGLTPLRTRQLQHRLPPVWFRPLSHLIPTLVLAQESGHHVPSHLHPADERTLMMETMAMAFLTLADIAPLTLVLDDMQLADLDTIQALTRLGTQLESHRIVLVVAYRRSEAREQPDVWSMMRSFDQQLSSTRISLAPFGAEQTRALIRHSLNLPTVDNELTTRVLQETGGLPLLIIELLRSVRDSGPPEEPTDQEGAGVVPGRLPLAVAVAQMVHNRINRLPDNARAVANLLAVHPGVLALEQIIAALGVTDRTVVDALDDLIRKGLVVEYVGGYQLGDALLSRVLYSDLSESLRLTLHRSVALILEHHHPNEAELLAHHFSAANMLDRAAQYLELAAARAISVSAYDTAARHLAQALEAIDGIGGSPEREFRVAARLEEVLDVLARRDEQGIALERMQRTAEGNAISDVRRRRSWWLAHQDRFVEADTEARRSLELARSTGDTGRVVAALTTLGMIACLAGRAADGVVYLERAASFRGANLRQQADARNALGNNLLDLQRFEEAEPQLLAALALYSELTDERGQAEVLGTLGTLRMERGEPSLAESYILRAIQKSRHIGYRHGEAVHQMNLGILRALTNRPHTAIQSFTQAANTYVSMGNRRGQALVLSNAAWLKHSLLGDDVGAERDSLKALSVYEQIGDPRGRAQCLATIGSIRHRGGQAQEAHVYLQQSLEGAQQAQDSWVEAQILKEWARCDLENGVEARGLQRADAALLLCSEFGFCDLAISVKALKGRLLMEIGRLEEALSTTTESVQSLRTGIDSAHLVLFAHGLSLSALGRQAEGDQYVNRAYRQLQSLLEDLPEEDRQVALARVPVHREILEMWERRQPRRIRHKLARADAPQGRPLSDGEYVYVTWTVDCPDDLTTPSAVTRRRRRLLRLVSEAAAQGGVPTVADLAEGVGTSVSTTRRDLASLRQQGHSIATRGSRGTD